MSAAPNAATPATTAPGATPKVSIEGLHKFFGELHVLRGIDMTVQPGAVTVLVLSLYTSEAETV